MLQAIFDYLRTLRTMPQPEANLAEEEQYYPDEPWGGSYIAEVLHEWNYIAAQDLYELHSADAEE